MQIIFQNGHTSSLPTHWYACSATGGLKVIVKAVAGGVGGIRSGRLAGSAAPVGPVYTGAPEVALSAGSHG